jgi:hypothetical protein
LWAQPLDGSAKVSRTHYRLTKLFNLGNGIHSNQMNRQREKASFYDAAEQQINAARSD